MPSELANYLTNRHYLHATQLLVSALKLGGTSLEDVEALRELRSELDTKKQVCIYSKIFVHRLTNVN